MKAITLLFAILFCASVSNAQSSVPCNICNYAVPLVEGYIKSSQYSVATIETDLSSVCSYFGAFQQQCAQFVSTYTQQIVQQLVAGVPSDQICYEIYACSTESKPQQQVHAAVINNNKNVGDDSLQCQICTYAVPLVEEYIKAGNYNQTWIETQLESVCTFLPAPYSSLCDTFITTYTSQIIQELENGTPASQVCVQIAACQASKSKPMMKVAPKPLALIKKPFNPKDDSLQCQICNYAVPLVEEYIQSSHYNTSYIEAQLQQAVCSWLPAPYNTLCNTFVNTYTQSIINELESGTPAAQVCSELGLCVSKKLSNANANVHKNKIFSLMAKINTSPQDDSLQCQICTYAVPLVEEYLQSADCNQTCIENQLDQAVCTWLPAPYSTLCGTFINTYTGPIIAELEKGTPADQVCTSLALCTSSNVNNKDNKKQKMTIF